MHPNFYLSPLAACLALTMASSVKAAEPVTLQKNNLPQIQQKFQISVPGMKLAAPLAGPDSLQFVKQHTDLNKVNHVRLQQTYAGFTVVGGYAIMHSPQSAKTMLTQQNNVDMTGLVYEGLAADLGKPSADFVKNGAKALDQFKSNYHDQAISQEQVTPVVYIDDNNQAHWAYKVSIFVTYTDKIPERPTAIIDASSNQTYLQWNDVKTAERAPVKGMGFGGNKKAGMVSYGKNLPYLDLTRDAKLNRCFMENIDTRVVDMQHRYSSDNTAMKFNCKVGGKNTSDTFWTGYKGDGYDKDNGGYSPTNDALYSGYVIKHMYYDWYGVQVLTRSDGSPMQLVMRVHYGDGYENAFWDGQQMTFGDGESMMYPLVSLGVGAHEISHGFTEQHSGLEYYGQSGGMNESFSDMAAMAAEFYSLGQSSWMIGAEIMKESSGWEALRYMDVPSKDGSSIDSAADYNGNLDVHYSSGVYNRLYYLISTQQGWDPRKAFDVMVKANMDYWTPYSTFDQAACGVLSAAKDLGYETNGIKKSLDTVAVKYNKCA